MNQNGLAISMTFLAGSATIIGGLLALLLRRSIKPVPFAGALGFAGGVMTFVSFVEIYMEGLEQLEEGFSARGGWMDSRHIERSVSATGMSLFFAGWILASVMDGGLHLLLDAHSERSVAKPKETTPSTEIHSCSLSTSLNGRPGGSDLELEESTATVAVHVDDDYKKKEPSCWRQFVDSKYFKALVGTEDLDKGAKLIAEKQFYADCHKITRLGYFTAFVLALHNIPEGIATFTGGAADARLGAGLAIAIGIHNIPEGLAVAVPILFGTGSAAKALIYAGVSGMAEPLGGLLAWWAMGDKPAPMVFGILFFLTAGIMVNVALKELLFAAIRYDTGNRITSISFVAGMVVMAVSLIALDFSEA